MRLIDADALILALEMQDYSCAPDTLEDWTPQDMTKAEIADIEHAPTIDAVEVVRCKDCKHWQNEHLCRAFSQFGTIETQGDDYCSHGERKEE